MLGALEMGRKKGLVHERGAADRTDHRSPESPRDDNWDTRGATRQRIAKAEGHIEIGRDERGQPTVTTMRDTPIERLKARHCIGQKEYDAAQKWHIHWHRAGLSAPIHAIDLNCVFASDNSFGGMARTEAQAFHRQQYRRAVDEIGVQAAAIVNAVVCEGFTVEDVGYKLGWGNRPQAVAAATERLRMALQQLVRFWGM